MSQLCLLQKETLLAKAASSAMTNIVLLIYLDMTMPKVQHLVHTAFTSAYLIKYLLNCLGQQSDILGRMIFNAEFWD